MWGADDRIKTPEEIVAAMRDRYLFDRRLLSELLHWALESTAGEAEAAVINAEERKQRLAERAAKLPQLAELLRRRGRRIYELTSE